MTETASSGGGLLVYAAHPWALWIPFGFAVSGLLALDLGLFQRAVRDPSPRRAIVWSGLWVALACVFGVGVLAARGPTRGVEFFTGYLVEQALSVDNLFVMMLVFAQLRIPRHAQRRVLVWGIVGAAVLRGVLVFAGASLVARFHVLTYALGALLVYAALKLMRDIGRGGSEEEGEAHPSRSLPGRMLSRVMPMTDELHGARFTVLRDGVRYATPLLLALVTIELADLVFALDSIPAVFGVTTDPFIVFTSNLFAILGLRSMFFVLSRLLDKLAYLKHGLVVVLFVVGAKMLLAWAWELPAWTSLVLVTSILGVAVAASLLEKKGKVNDAFRS